MDIRIFKEMITYINSPINHPNVTIIIFTNLNITSLNIKAMMITVPRKTDIKTGMGNQTNKIHLFRDWTKISYIKAYPCQLVAPNAAIKHRTKSIIATIMETDTKKTK